MSRRCQLKVETLVLENPDMVIGCGLEWKYNPETKELHVKIANYDDRTMSKSTTKITTATRDYNLFM